MYEYNRYLEVSFCNNNNVRRTNSNSWSRIDIKRGTLSMDEPPKVALLVEKFNEFKPFTIFIKSSIWDKTAFQIFIWLSHHGLFGKLAPNTQPVFICSKPGTQTIQQIVKSVQSLHYKLWTNFRRYSDVFVVDFKQVNASLDD